MVLCVSACRQDEVRAASLRLSRNGRNKGDDHEQQVAHKILLRRQMRKP